ncbi:hypothetical protein QTL86_03360 [Cellulosilyticum sp. ST5]|uniref:hypothetical protein n=1 Tax=Cellulosilyticum sp. ST5 TaxID=3055805 RepID=UPI003977CB25
MKAWVKILNEMFNEVDYPFETLINKHPERTKRDMIKVFTDDKLTVSDIVGYLPHKDVVGKTFNSFEELFDLDISGFEHKVLIGNSRQKEQIGIEDILGFKPKVIK